MGVELTYAGEPWPVQDSLEELQQLAETAGCQVVGVASQKLKAPHPAHYIGKGKLEEIASLKDSLDFDMLLLDDEVSPSQLRSLEQALDVKVVDRTALILDIFAQRAHSHEGRLQVELAQYEYLLPRMRGRWTHLERQTGGIGARAGPGETQLEVDRRRVRQRITTIQKELDGVRRHRALYRHQRAEEGIPVVSLVGYTNAGKSTLLNALTAAGILVDDRLFATLDPVTRRLPLPSGRQVLMTDTVGFIHKLPPQLVAAFSATLEEMESASVLVDVLDASHPKCREQNQSVLHFLAELSLLEKPVITVLSKVDRLVPQLHDALATLEGLKQQYSNAVLISAEKGWGLDDLLAEVDAVLSHGLVEVRVRLPYDASELLVLFRERGSISKVKYTDSAALLEGRIPQRLMAQFQAYIVPRRARRRPVAPPS